jgi:glutathione-regulated potassium-efflux system ancillary protein KefC
VLVVAMDDVEQSLALVDLAREHFPKLQVVARARDVTHWNALRERGVTHRARDCSSRPDERAQRAGADGPSPPGAQDMALRFRAHNLERWPTACTRTTRTAPS